MVNTPAWCAIHQQNGILVSGKGAACVLCFVEVNPAAQPQPAPRTGTTVILPLVIADLEARAEMGEQKYGMRLMVENGRDHLEDAYQEALDLCMYLRAALEQKRKSAWKIP